MGFFGGGADDTGAGLGGSAGAGGVPSAAEQRLAQLAAGELFTSTLDVGEFALLSKLGPSPVAQVMGASVHCVGWQYLPPTAQWGGEVFCQLDAVSQAWDDARRLALARLSEEAEAVGADAVVAVRLRRGDHDWARGSVDYVVSGTAIRTGQAERDASGPALSDLSALEYWKLASTGWAPSGLVAATAVLFVSQSIGTQWQRRATLMRNQELTDYSRGFSRARRAAVQMLRDQARRAGADGVVGVQIDHDVSRARLRVGVTAASQSTGVTPTSLAMGADAAPRGRDSRSGIVVTIQTVGSAIRRRGQGDAIAPRAIMRLGVPG